MFFTAPSSFCYQLVILLPYNIPIFQNSLQQKKAIECSSSKNNLFRSLTLSTLVSVEYTHKDLLLGCPDLR